MNTHTVRMELSPSGIRSRVWLDDEEISDLLRGVEVQSHVGMVTRITLQCITPQHTVDLIVRLPEAAISIRAPERMTAMPGCDCDQPQNPDPAAHASNCTWRQLREE